MAIKDWLNFNFIPYESKIKKSAGVVIILKKEKILLCHATKSKWFGTFGPPKGGVNEGESEIDGALRELKEETGIVIDKNKITNPKKPIIIDYTYKSGVKYKKLFLYTVYVEDVSELGMMTEVIPVMELQIEEIDWCGFVTKKDAKKRILSKFSNLLDLLNNKK